MRKITFLILGFLLVSACRKTKKVANPKDLDSLYLPYIQAYTSGLVNRDTPLKFRFTRPITTPDSQNQKTLPSLTINPSVKGTLRWSDQQTLEFVPETFWPTGKNITAELDLGDIFDTIPTSLQYFSVLFQTRAQEIKISHNEIQPLNLENMQWYQITGEIHTFQRELNDLVEKSFSAQPYNGKVRWKHNAEGTKHQFILDSIERKETEYQLRLSIKKDLLNIGFDKESTLRIPSLGDFSIIQAELKNEPETHIELEFSDPLKNNQHWETFIYSKQSKFTFTHHANKLILHPKTTTTPTISLTLLKGIKNSSGYAMKADNAFSFDIEKPHPQIRYDQESGIIVPHSTTLPFSFRAINLTAVDLQITKIHEHNVLQFLQHNDLSGDWYLHYVGNVLIEKKIALARKNCNLESWNRHVINLGELIKSDPGAVYRVEVRFRKEYAIWDCPHDEEENKIKEEKYDVLLDKPGLWDYYDNYDYEYISDPTPCDKYFYRNGNHIAQNILSSDLGLTAKYDQEGGVFSAVTELSSAEPAPFVKVLYYNFQKKLLGSATTDAKGIASSQLAEKPYFMVAQRNQQRGYLKFNSDKLSYSNFEISGTNAFKGVKGYLFAERGVWRPGDSLYINFILDDSKRMLPPDYPLVFELMDPNGNSTAKIVRKKNLNGFYSFHTATDLSAPTGFYTAKVNVGGVKFEKTFQIETIIPNKLKLQYTFSDSILTKQHSSIGALHIQWLNGATASKLKTTVEYTTTTVKQPFGTSLNGFDFIDPVSEAKTNSDILIESTLDELGNLTIPNKFNKTEFCGGMMKINLATKCYEPGGNFSSDYSQIVFSPFDSYVGIKGPEIDNSYNVLITNTDNYFDLAMVNSRGIPLNASCDIELFKLEYRSWWEIYDEDETFNGKSYKQSIRKDSVTFRKGKASWKCKIPTGESGRYYLRVSIPNGHSAGLLFFAEPPGWYTRYDQQQERNNSITVRCNKQSYRVGETVTVEITDSLPCQYLITTEKSSKVLQAEWLNSNSNPLRRYSFTVTPDMAPNFYLYVSAFQPYYAKHQEIPLRRYSVVPIQVDDPNAHLEPQIETTEKWKPESKVSIQVSEKNNKAMTYTIAIVDEGLLDLTHFKTPDPYHYFHAKEALLISTSDIYGNIKTGLKRNEQQMLSIGGDGTLDNSRLQRFKPMVRFMGPYFLPEGQKKSHSVQLPNYNGSVRVMVVAGFQQAYGKKELTKTINNPLMIQATLPRVLGPMEEIQIPVSVFVEKPGTPIKIEIVKSENITLTGKSFIEFTPDKKADYQFYFPAKTNKTAGTAHIRVNAAQGKLFSHEEINVAVRLPNQRIFQSSSKLINPNSISALEYAPVGIEGTNQALLELSALPSINLEKRLQYLIQYPHGCVEQTTSAVFPQLCLSDLTDLSEDQKKHIEKNVKAGIKRLYQFQHSSGEMSYWPGDSYVSEWGTLYAGHFMLIASQKGYSVSEKFLQAWKTSLARSAAQWSVHDNDHFQAYRLYLLALAGNADLASMNRMKELLKANTTASWFLAGAYHLAGQKNIASKMTESLSTQITPYREYAYSYGSDFRDKAILLHMMSTIGLNEKSFAMAEHLCKILSSDSWLSTQETAYSLIALSNYSKGKFKETKRIDLTIGGKKTSISLIGAMSTVPLSTVNKQKIEINNLSGIPIYATIVSSGIPEQGFEKAYQSGVKLHVRYLNKKKEEIQVNQLKQGTDFYAEITVENISQKAEIEEMALSFRTPSGWQIQNPRLIGEENFLSSSVDYLDIRDDVVHYYFDLKKEKIVFVLALNASYIGKSYLPATSLEAMYDHRISANTIGQYVQVLK